MSEASEPVRANLLDAAGRIAGDQPCLSCGYNLRGLEPAAVCPECAYPIALSLRGERLCFAAPDWLRRVARGLGLVLLAMALMVLLGLGAVLFFALALARLPVSAGGTFPALAAQSVGLGLFTVLIVGLLLLTAREPATRTRPEALTSRRLIRVCLCIIPVPQVMQIVSTALPGTGAAGVPSAAFRILSPIWAAAGALANLVLVLAVLRYLRYLLRRVPRPGLARFCTVLFWWSMLTCGILAAGTTIMAFALPVYTATATMTVATTTTSAPAGAIVMSSTMPVTLPATVSAGATFTPGPLMTFAMAANSIGGCSALPLLIAGLILLLRARRVLAGAAREAAANAAP